MTNYSNLEMKVTEEIIRQFDSLSLEVCNLNIELKLDVSNDIVADIFGENANAVIGATIAELYTDIFTNSISHAHLKYVFFNVRNIAKTISNLSLGNCRDKMIEETVRFYINHELTHCYQFINEVDKYNQFNLIGVPLVEKEADFYAISKANDKDLAIVLANLNANAYKENYFLFKAIKSTLKIFGREIFKKIFK